MAGCRALLLLAIAVGLASCAGERTFRLNNLFSHDTVELRETPNWALGGLLPVEQRCPNGTGYVVRSADSSGRDLVLGCCPLGQQGCVPPGSDRVVGCCPRFTHCLYREESRDSANHEAFLGCADTVARDCYGKRCPRDYGCCRRSSPHDSVCAPHERGDDDDTQVANALDYDAYCGESELLWPRMSVYALRTAKFRYYIRPPRLLNRTNITVPGLSSEVEASFVASPPQYTCSSTSLRCHVSDACAERNITITPPAINATVATNRQRSYCCPAAGNYSLCVVNGGAGTNSTSVGEFIGCADLDAGEQCCGRSICPDQSKCCESRNNVGEVVDRFCCPVQLECCYGDPARAATDSEQILNQNTIAPRSYCGVRIGNSTCQFDRQSPLNWLFLHIAAAHYGNT